MMFVEIVDVLTGDDVDLVIPFTIEGIELLKLLQLCLREGGEVFLYQFCLCHESSVLKRRVQYLTDLAIGDNKFNGADSIGCNLVGIIDEGDRLIVEDEVFRREDIH